MRQPLNFIYLLGPLHLSQWYNNEIRYSLRSIECSFDVGWVGITGPELPPFLTGIKHFPVPLSETNKYRNMQRQLLAACVDPDTPEDLILMNDDFIVKPGSVWDWHPTHRGKIEGPSDKGNGWLRTVRATRDWLISSGLNAPGCFKDPLCYEGHTPMPFRKSLMVPVLERILQTPSPLQLRTAYGNINQIGGVLHSNAKSRDPITSWPADLPFWSLRSTVTDTAKAFLAAHFPSRSRWEVDDVATSSS